MFDDYFFRALIAGMMIACMAGPLGCFIIWQKLAYFGDTMAHSALLGVALSLLLHIHIMVGVFFITIIIALALFVLQRFEKISSDSLLGILSHATLAIGMVLVGFMTWTNLDINSTLFGDILAVSKQDLVFILLGCVVILFAITILWRPLLTLTINQDLAKAENMKPELARFIFMMLMATIIAVSIQIIGILLITALLIIPVATARHFAKSPEQMAIIAIIIGILGVILGLYGSLYYDSRSGPTIVVALFFIFLFSRFGKSLIKEKPL